MNLHRLCEVHHVFAGAYEARGKTRYEEDVGREDVIASIVGRFFSVPRVCVVVR